MLLSVFSLAGKKTSDWNWISSTWYNQPAQQSSASRGAKWVSPSAGVFFFLPLMKNDDQEKKTSNRKKKRRRRRRRRRETHRTSLSLSLWWQRVWPHHSLPTASCQQTTPTRAHTHTHTHTHMCTHTHTQLQICPTAVGHVDAFFFASEPVLPLQNNQRQREREIKRKDLFPFLRTCALVACWLTAICTDLDMHTHTHTHTHVDTHQLYRHSEKGSWILRVVDS